MRKMAVPQFTPFLPGRDFVLVGVFDVFISYQGASQAISERLTSLAAMALTFLSSVR